MPARPLSVSYNTWWWIKVHGCGETARYSSLWWTVDGLSVVWFEYAALKDKAILKSSGRPNPETQKEEQVGTGKCGAIAGSIGGVISHS